jgi:K+ transporter
LGGLVTVAALGVVFGDIGTTPDLHNPDRL